MTQVSLPRTAKIRVLVKCRYRDSLTTLRRRRSVRVVWIRLEKMSAKLRTNLNRIFLLSSNFSGVGGEYNNMLVYALMSGKVEVCINELLPQSEYGYCTSNFVRNIYMYSTVRKLSSLWCRTP